MTARTRQPVIRFRVPHSGFLDEVKRAAASVGETPSQFIRRAIAERIYRLET